jgi:hypothetical protein
MAEETDHEMPDLVDSSSDEGENGHMPIFIDMEVEQPKAREGMKRERDMAWGVVTVTLDMLPAKPRVHMRLIQELDALSSSVVLEGAKR